MTCSDMSINRDTRTLPPQAQQNLFVALTGRGNGHISLWRARARAKGLDSLDDLERLVIGHLAKDNVLAVQPARHDGRDKELRAVGVLAGIGHGQQAWAGVLELEVLVLELLAVD